MFLMFLDHQNLSYGTLISPVFASNLLIQSYLSADLGKQLQDYFKLYLYFVSHDQTAGESLMTLIMKFSFSDGFYGFHS